MKKNLKNIVLCLFLALMMPIALVLSGCGATATSEARGVKFQSAMYDEATGLPIFEVDLGVKTEIPFKVTPSSWSGYVPTYTPIDEGPLGNNIYYDRKQNKITISDERFKPIQVKISVNGYSDTCIIKLKKYPISMHVNETDVYINALGVHTINPIGVFEEKDDDGIVTGTYEKPLIEEHYNFTVVSEDPTIVSVPNESRLKVYSVRKKTASTNVKVTLNDSQGKSRGLSQTVKVSVIQNASVGFALIDKGYGKFVENGDKIEVKLTDLQMQSGQYVFGYKLYIESENGSFFEVDSMTTTDNSRYFETDKTDTSVLLIDPNFAVSVDKSVKINVWTTLVDEDGDVFALSFDIDFVA